MNLSRLLRPNIAALKPYASARDEFEGTASVYLDANENPFPSAHHRYPDPHQQSLKKRISEIKHVPLTKIFVGNGSDEAIDLLFRAFCVPGQDDVIILHPTYGMYSVSAAIHDVKIISVPLTRDFDLDANAVLKAVTPKTKIIFLCSPNNPTGNRLNRDAIQNLLTSFDGIVIVDEAYIDFSSDVSWVTQLDKFENLVVLQTLSKAWGLASLRIGLCFAHPEIISILGKIKPPYNISGIAQQLAEEALQQVDKKENMVRDILQERERLVHDLKTSSVVDHVYPSDANFVLVRMKANARTIYEALLTKGIVVRDRSSVKMCEGCLRITVGTKKENDQLLDYLRSL